MIRAILVALLGIACTSTKAVSADHPVLAEPTGSTGFPLILQNPERWTLRHWDKGFLIGLDQREGSASDLLVYDASGVVTVQTSITFPGNDDIALRSVTFDPAKNLIVAGGTMSHDGAVANFVAQVGSDGSIQRLVRVNPFVSQAICSAQVGKVWAIGTERGAMPSSSYPILREFDLGKGELRSAIPRNSTKLSPQGRFPGDTQLRCTPSSVVVYSSTSGELFKYDLSTNALHSWKLSSLDPKSTRLTGFGVNDKGQIFASLHRLPTKDQPFATGLFLLIAASDGTAKWEVVPGTMTSLSLFKLLGVSGNKLVYMKDARDPIGAAFFSSVAP